MTDKKHDSIPDGALADMEPSLARDPREEVSSLMGHLILSIEQNPDDLSEVGIIALFNAMEKAIVTSRPVLESGPRNIRRNDALRKIFQKLRISLGRRTFNDDEDFSDQVKLKIAKAITEVRRAYSENHDSAIES